MSRRLLHSGPRVPDFAGGNVVRATPKVDPLLPKQTTFRVLGAGSLLQVSLPPSTKLRARRNALAGIMGGAEASAHVRVASSPLTRLWTRQPLLEQTILGTSTLTCLIGAPARRSHLTSLDLDGTQDWAVTPPSQILAYSGRGLIVSPRTGWRFGSVPGFRHVLLSGRGAVGIASPAPLVQLQLAECESVVVSQRHLAAFSLDVNSQPPPQRTAVAYSFSRAKDANVEEAKAGTDATTTSALPAWRKYLRSTWFWIASATRKILRRGNSGPYVQVFGPSTVLVSASSLTTLPVGGGGRSEN